jgi:M6 family metalloprotease-like protein
MTSFRSVALVLLILMPIFVAGSAVLRNYPQTLVQPDGSLVQCYTSGDEFHHWLHDAQNYTIVQDPGTGNFVYALLDKGTLVPTAHVVGKADPQAVGLMPGANIAASAMQAMRQGILAKAASGAMAAGTVGTLNNIVVFIRFSDEPAGVFSEAPAVYESMFNSALPEVTSLFRYYREASYGQLNVLSTFYPSSADVIVSCVDAHPRNYYRKYNAVTNPAGYAGGNDAGTREQTMLANALRTVSAQIPADLAIDANNDGYVDNVCFVVSGGVEAWADLLWPHMSSLTIERVPINGKVVGTYNFQLRDALLNPGNMVYVLAHELFHSLGAPDLYHYSHLPPDPVGPWDIMDYSGNPPVHMSAYMKWKYGGWISSLPVISTPGVYALSPLVSSTRNCFKIPSIYSKKEFFVVEYRRAEGAFERTLPSSGLLVYRVNPDRHGNADGPPDELYLYRPGGTISVNGSLSAAYMCADGGRTTLSDSTSPSGFLTDGSPGGLILRDVGYLGDSITFRVDFPKVPIVALSTRAIYFDPIGDETDRIDTSVVVRNIGYGTDSITTSITPGGVGPDSALTASPLSFVLAPGDSHKVMISIRPRLIAPGYYSAGVLITSRFGMDPRTLTTMLDFEKLVTGVDSRSAVPTGFSLDQNSPNPFNPSTTIRFGLPTREHVILAVFNTLGQQVAVLHNGEQEAGYHEVQFDASGLSSGVYFYRMQVRPSDSVLGRDSRGGAGSFVGTKKSLLVR